MQGYSDTESVDGSFTPRFRVVTWPSLELQINDYFNTALQIEIIITLYSTRSAHSISTYNVTLNSNNWDAVPPSGAIVLLSQGIAISYKCQKLRSSQYLSTCTNLHPVWFNWDTARDLQDLSERSQLSFMNTVITRYWICWWLLLLLGFLLSLNHY